jgi:hypothetical protein
MKKYFANYNQSLALKELGFDMPCFAYVYTGDTGNNVDRYEEVEPSRAINYNHDSLCVSQPLKSQVFEWFRENYGKLSLVFKDEIHYWYEIESGIYQECTSKGFDSYEEAESACIDKLIKIVKDERKIN